MFKLRSYFGSSADETVILNLESGMYHGLNSTAARMLQALESRGLAVESVTVARPSLDDVYLRYTGRAFAEADAEGAQK